VLASPMRTAVLGSSSLRRSCTLLTPLMGRLARLTGAVDNPTDDRRMHVAATPLLGGLGMYLGWMIPVMLLVDVDRPAWGIIGGATIVVAVGLFDDLYELEPIVKFMGQLPGHRGRHLFDIHIEHMSIPFTGVTLHFPLRYRSRSPPSGWR